MSLIALFPLQVTLKSSKAWRMQYRSPGAGSEKKKSKCRNHIFGIIFFQKKIFTWWKKEFCKILPKFSLC
jgi:hypothetical protein